MQYLVTGGAGFIGSNIREVAFVCARHNPVDGCPFPPLANQLLNSYLKSGTAAKALFTKPRSSCLPRVTTPNVTSSKIKSLVKSARSLSQSFEDDQALAHSSGTFPNQMSP